MSESQSTAPTPESALPSRTSIWAAAARALGARDPDPAVRNPDWMAAKIIGPEERAMIAEQRVIQVADQEYATASADMEAMGPARALLVRTHYIDQKLLEAVRAGAKQAVILGAGFDTRAYRFKDELRNIRVFEVDRPATQQYKQRRVREIIEQIPSNLTYAPFDFRKEKIGEALLSAGWEPPLKTFFIWEGVTMYLRGEVVRETFEWLSAHAAPGSGVVFDYIHDAVIQMIASIPFDKAPEGPEKDAVLRWKRLIEHEPWLSGLPAHWEAEYLEKVGWKVKEILAMGGPEAEKRFLTRQDGSVFCPIAGDMKGKPQMYWLAEAVIPG